MCLQGPDQPYYVLHIVIQEWGDRTGVQLAQGIVFQRLGDGLPFGAARHIKCTVRRPTQVTAFAIFFCRGQF
jgi:hypothetical protein